MNTADRLEKVLRERMGGDISLREKGKESFFVLSPFAYDDGDLFRVILRRKGDTWELTDEGHTLMFLSYYDVNIDAPTRQEVLNKTLSYHSVRMDNGQMMIEAENENQIAGAFYSFVQALTKISNISMWTRERAKSLFFEEFRTTMTSLLPRYRTDFDCYELSVDPGKLYKIDCRIEVPDKKDVFVFAVNSDNKGKETVITILNLEKNRVIRPSIVIYENQEEIGKKVIAQISDAADKTFSSLGVAKERFLPYFEEKIVLSGNASD